MSLSRVLLIASCTSRKRSSEVREERDSLARGGPERWVHRQKLWYMETVKHTQLLFGSYDQCCCFTLSEIAIHFFLANNGDSLFTQPLCK